MKTKGVCIFCEDTTRNSTTLVCKRCKRKVEIVQTYQAKLERLKDKYKHVRIEELGYQDKRIVQRTMSGATQKEIADTYRISSQRVAQVLERILKEFS